MTAPTVACVLRSGGGFLPEHVEALYLGVQNHWSKDLPLRFVVLTNIEEEVWPTGGLGFGIERVPLAYSYVGWWSKLELFLPCNEDLGDILYFDLDTVILGDLTDIASTRTLTLLTDFYTPKSSASGMMYLPLESRPAVWDRWAARVFMTMKRMRGDQDFLRATFRALGVEPERWQLLWPGQVASYKQQCQQLNMAPAGTRVVCFHGRPRPWQLGTPLKVAEPEAVSIHEERWADVVDDDRGGPYAG